MRGQDTEASCGPRAMYNALQALGIQRSTEECERLCCVSMTNGTSTNKLVTALRAIDGLNPKIIRERRKDIAMMRLLMACLAGRPVIVLVKTHIPDDHYVVVLACQGSAGERYLICDSADHELVISKTANELSEWWGADSASAWGVVL